MPDHISCLAPPAMHIGYNLPLQSTSVWLILLTRAQLAPFWTLIKAAPALHTQALGTFFTCEAYIAMIYFPGTESKNPSRVTTHQLPWVWNDTPARPPSTYNPLPELPVHRHLARKARLPEGSLSQNA